MTGKSFLAPLILALGSCSSGGAERTSAVLITLDTTRADAIGCYGALPAVTPHLDAIASEGVLYEWARSVAAITLPAHCSMMTGLYPPRHTIRGNNIKALPSSALTLAERAAARGYDTAAFVAAVVLDDGFGLDQGFEVYGQPRRPNVQASTIYTHRPASSVVAEAKAWLAQRDSSKPYFLWVHFFDPHAPYLPGAEFLEAAANQPYYGEIAQMDAAIGELIASLREQESWPRTALMVVADHGEGLHDHAEATHASYCYDSTLRVPLILRYPDGARAGERSDEIVSVTDVYPTLIEAMQLGDVGDVDGQSLFHKSVPEDRGVYFESYDGYTNYGWAQLSGWADRGGKYIHAPTPVFFDPLQDPGETRDLAQSRAERLPHYQAHLRQLTARSTQLALPMDESERADGRMLAPLRALGYAAAGDPTAELPEPLEDTGRPDPHERKQELNDCLRALSVHQAGRTSESVAILQGVLRDNPNNLYALNWLAGCLAEDGRRAEAIPVLLRLLEVGPENMVLHLNLAQCYDSQKQPRLAIRHYEKVLGFNPQHKAARKRLNALRRNAGQD